MMLTPSHCVFIRLHWRFARKRSARTQDIEENVLHQIHDTLSFIPRCLAHEVGNSRSKVWRIYTDNEMHLYRVERVHALQRVIMHVVLLLENSISKSFLKTRSARTPDVEENVLHQVEDTLSLSTQSLAHELRISRSNVWRFLRDKEMHPYHVERVNALELCDYSPRIGFRKRYFEQRSLQERSELSHDGNYSVEKHFQPCMFQ